MKILFKYLWVPMAFAACAKDSLKEEEAKRTRSRESISKTIANKKNLAKECLTKATTPSQPINGELKLELTIESSGRVSTAKVLENTTGSKILENCMKETFQKTDFDAGYYLTIVTWPWVFKP